jgi:iron complex transport system permease protein
MRPLVRNPFLLYPLLLLLLAGSCALSVSVGAVRVPAAKVLQVLIRELPWLGRAVPPVDDTFAVIVRDIRLPRAILALLVGASLSASGAVMQGFFRNPMADPYIVGVSSGAALGATGAYVLHLDIRLFGLGAVPMAAFAGAMGAILLVYGMSVRGGQVPVALLLLTGVAVGALATAAVSFMMLMGEEDVRTLMFWLMGSLSSRGWAHVRMVIPYMVAGLAVIAIYSRDLNVLLMGEETARHLGLEVERVKRVLLIASALLAASAVAVGVIIGFVGLIVPHVTRMLVGPDHRRLIATSALFGGVLVIVADVAARTVASPGEVPIGIITAALGCPFFLFLLARRRETGW